MTIEDPSSLSSLSAALLNHAGNTPLAVRFRALFALKALASEGNNQAVDIIAEGPPFQSWSKLTTRLSRRERAVEA